MEAGTSAVAGCCRRWPPFPGTKTTEEIMDIKVDFKLLNQQTTGAWRSFLPGQWQDRINLRDFIQHNYTPFEGDGSFLAGPTERTLAMWQKLGPLIEQERAKGILDVSQIPSSILAHDPGY